MRTFILSAIIIASTGIISCNNSSDSNSSKTANTATAKSTAVGQKEFYTCEMDTAMISDKPGKCPKCGMDLTKKMLPDTTRVTVK